MKKIFVVALTVLMVQPVWAAKVSLNSGVTVEGAILNVASDSIKVDVSGVPVTYYKDEIASIEGDDAAVKTLGLGGAAVQPVEPVAAVPPLVEPVAPAVVEPPVAEVAAVAAPDQAAGSVDKKKLILRFIDLFGTRQAMTQNFEQMMASLPKEQSDKLREAFKIDEIVEALVPLYDKYFTVEDLQAYNNFYESPEGLKLIQSIPRIMKDSVAVSAQYFETRMPEEIKNAKMPKAPAPAVKP